MKHRCANPIHITKVSKEALQLLNISNCIELHPGLLLRFCHDSEQITKISHLFMIDHYMTQEGNFKLECILQEWEEEMFLMSESIKRKFGTDVALMGSKRNKKEHKCKICDRVFAKAQALGGHTSKMHSNIKNKQISNGLKTLKKKTRKEKPIAKTQTSLRSAKTENNILNVIVEQQQEV